MIDLGAIIVGLTALGSCGYVWFRDHPRTPRRGRYLSPLDKGLWEDLPLEITPEEYFELETHERMYYTTDLSPKRLGFRRKSLKPRSEMSMGEYVLSDDYRKQLASLGDFSRRLNEAGGEVAKMRPPSSPGKLNRRYLENYLPGYTVESSLDLLYWKGYWTPYTIYVPGDAVYSSDASYICMEEHSSSKLTEPSNGASWEIYWVRLEVTPPEPEELPSKGFKGVDGPVGFKGPTGIAGF